MEERHRTPPRGQRLTFATCVAKPLLTLRITSVFVVSRGQKRRSDKSQKLFQSVHPSGRVQTACGCPLSTKASTTTTNNKIIYIYMRGWTSRHIRVCKFLFSVSLAFFLFFNGHAGRYALHFSAHAASRRPTCLDISDEKRIQHGKSGHKPMYRLSSGQTTG